MGTYSESLLGPSLVQEREPEIDPVTNSYSSQLLGSPQSVPADVAPVQAEEKPKQGWGEWFTESIKGKHDPKYQGAGTVFEQFKDDLKNPTSIAALLGASDAQMADVIAHQLGDRLIRRERDSNGYDVFVTQGPDGLEQFGYVNAPGLDWQDVSRGVHGAVPYVVGGGLIGTATKGAALGWQALAQGLGAGATSVAGDAGQMPMGSEQGVELPKAAVMTGLGAAGPLVAGSGAYLWRRFVTEPKYFNRSTGQLTPLGEKAARDSGLDPAALTPELKKTFAKTYAANPKDASAAVNAVTDKEFGIPSTIGQRTKDSEQLLKEKAMRSGVYGPQAKEIIVGADEAQRAAVERATRETIPGTISGSPMQAPFAATPAEMGERITTGLSAAQKAAKAEEKAAWDLTKDMKVVVKKSEEPDVMTPMTGVKKTVTEMQAMPLLADSIKNNLGDLADIYSPELTPTAFKMGAYLQDFIQGTAPSTKLHKSFGMTRKDTVDSVRKSIGLMVPDAETQADKAAARAVYRAYDDWMKQAADQGLITGDMAAVTQLRTARDISKEMRSIFEPREEGVLTPGGKLIEKILDSADTPERVVSALFSGPKADIKAGTVEAIANIKKGLDKYVDKTRAREVWNDIRLAHWAKITQGGNGELLGYQALRENLKNALNKQSTLTKSLYTPDEIAQLRRFVNELERITYKDPNPSGTSTGVAVFAKQFVGKLLDAFGGMGRTAFEISGLPRAHGTSLAKRAVGTALGKPKPDTSASIALPAIGQPYGRRD